jgi:enamine deaminase RidA (YjgF/YER057c/UK114 family)
MYEQTFSYSRAVRRGSQIMVSGTTALDAKTGVLLHPGSAYLQAQTVFASILDAVQAVGGTSMNDVVRVRMYVRDKQDADEVARAMREAIGHVEFTATMICGVGFVEDEMLVEVEADAIVSDK